MVFSLNVTNGSAESCPFIIARLLERLTWQGRAVCPIVSAVLARGVCPEIPLFFYATEIAAARMMLVFFWKSA